MKTRGFNFLPSIRLSKKKQGQMWIWTRSSQICAVNSSERYIVMSYAVGLGAIFYAPTKRKAKYRIKRVCESTTATSIFLGIVHQNNPELSIGKIKLLLEDKTKFIRNPEAIKVCDEYIKLGYGDYVPHRSYRRGT